MNFKTNNIKDFKIHTSVLFVIVIAILSGILLRNSNNGSKKVIDYSNELNNIHIPFIENSGQLPDQDIAYYARTPAATVFIMKNGEIGYSLPGGKCEYFDDYRDDLNNTFKGNSILLSELFIGNSIKEITGEKKSSTEVNLFLGNNSELWQTGIPAFEFIDFGEIYKGIGFKLKAYGNTIEKLFIVYPGADPDRIRIKAKRAGHPGINSNGELVLNIGKGDILFSKPVAYVINNGRKKNIKTAWVIHDDGTYGFNVGTYNRHDTLLIDPLLASTLIGGNGYERIRAIGTDSEGNIFVAGYTTSTDFPVTFGAYDKTYNDTYDTDVFISKFDSSLTTLMASTYIGGYGGDNCLDLEIYQDYIYLTGPTASTNFPIRKYDAYDTIPPNEGWPKVFVTKLSNELNVLIRSTYLGGTNFDRPNSIALDSTGNVFICGETNSQDFPVTDNAFCDTFHVIPYEDYSDGFISKLDNNLSTLISSTFIGGEDDDTPYSIAVSDSNEVYVAGYTSSPDFPITENAYDNILNSVKGHWRDGFICRFDSTLSDLKASTFLGGDSHDHIYTIQLDHSGDIIVGGDTHSENFPVTPGSFDQSFNGGEFDAFLSILNGNLTTLKSSTYVGGNGNEGVGDITFLNEVEFYFVGSTGSTNFPTTEGAFDEGDGITGGAYISRIDTGLKNLQVSTLLGGSKRDCGIRCAIVSRNSVYVAGINWESDFPTTPGAFSRTYIGGDNPIYLDCGDLFLSKFDPDLSAGINYVTPNHADDFQLETYPNPFSTVTRMKYRITSRARTDLSVYDIKGRKMKTLVNEIQQPGHYSVEWDGRDDNNNLVSAGLYFVTIRTNQGIRSVKVIFSENH